MILQYVVGSSPVSTVLGTVTETLAFAPVLGATRDTTLKKGLEDTVPGAVM